MLVLRNLAEEEAFQKLDYARQIIPCKNEIPVYELSLNYLTPRQNYKTKTYYFVGHLKFEELEYVYFNSEDIEDLLSAEKRQWENIQINSIEKLGNIFYLIDKNNYMDKFSSRNIFGDNKDGSLCQTLKRCHPKNIIFEKYGLRIPLIQVKYSYQTNRGNEREKESFIFSNSFCEQQFLSWINNFNAKYPYRCLSNVKILDFQTMGTLRFE